MFGSLSPSENRRSRRNAPVLLALVGMALGCGGDIEARMAEVRALQDVGQFTASIDELREVLAVSPDLPEATYRLGLALLQTGEVSRAVWALEKASESPEYAIPAGLLLASAHFHSRDFDAAVAAADDVLEIDPERVVALEQRAVAHLGAMRREEALADTERVLEIDPNNYTLHALRATVLAETGRIEEATEAHYQLREVAAASGDPHIAYTACIHVAMYARDYLDDTNKTASLYEGCVEEFPSNAFVLKEATNYLDDIKRSERATELIRKAVEDAPENLSLRATLANRLRRQGDTEGAEKVLVEAVDSFRSAGAWNLLATFYRGVGKPDEALSALEKVMELSGGGTDQLRFGVADVLVDLEELERAEEIANSLDEPIYATLIRGRIHLARNEAEQALRAFEQGIRHWPNNAGARYLAGLAARDLGDSDRAISELREAVRVDNRATDAAHVLSRIFLERGDHRKAVRFAKLALKRPGGRERPENFIVGARSFAALG